MSDFKLDYDEGKWFLTADQDYASVTIRLDDMEGFALLDALAPLVQRREDYEFHKQLSRGMRLAGLTPPTVSNP